MAAGSMLQHANTRSKQAYIYALPRNIYIISRVPSCDAIWEKMLVCKENMKKKSRMKN